MSTAPTTAPDLRLLPTGTTIPDEGYCDQPYVVKTNDGAWLCVMTTGQGREGEPGQHPITLRSHDHGATWGEKVELEPADGPEASYAVLLKARSGRVYAFYNYNTQNVREVKCEDAFVYARVYKRVDSLGDFVFRYSDDGGRTWSANRHTVPVREFACDRNNVYGGKVRFFWNVGRPCIRANGEALIPLIKVGAVGEGFFAQSEGAFILSSNLLTESDPEKIVFQTLPDGEHGLRTPAGGGRVAEEQSVTELSDGSLYCVYRSVDGWPVCSYSRDGGHTWEPPHYKTFTPGGCRIKHPRAANFVWKCGNGRYLYWFHNHGGSFVHKQAGPSPLSPGSWPEKDWKPYQNRNPVWVCAGQEAEGPNGLLLEWSQPEILLYDDDPYIRISYPDLLEEGGRFWITETQKSIARVHEIPENLLDGLFGQFEAGCVEEDGLLFRESRPGEDDWSLPMPALSFLVAPDWHRDDACGNDLRAGCTLELRIDGCPEPGTALFDSRNNEESGMLARMLPNGKIEVFLSDGKTVSYWSSDRGALAPDEGNHVCIIVDGGPKLILFVINGVLCDGGEERQFGWGRYNPNLQQLNGAGEVLLDACVAEAALYSRALRVSEAVQNSRRPAQVSPDPEPLVPA
jgi:hypothetical protein